MKKKKKTNFNNNPKLLSNMLNVANNAKEPRGFTKPASQVKLAINIYLLG